MLLIAVGMTHWSLDPFCQELKAIEVAQRTKELPASLQHENVAPEE